MSTIWDKIEKCLEAQNRGFDKKDQGKSDARCFRLFGSQTEQKSTNRSAVDPRILVCPDDYWVRFSLDLTSMQQETSDGLEELLRSNATISSVVKFAIGDQAKLQLRAELPLTSIKPIRIAELLRGFSEGWRWVSKQRSKAKAKTNARKSSTGRGSGNTQKAQATVSDFLTESSLSWKKCTDKSWIVDCLTSSSKTIYFINIELADENKSDEICFRTDLIFWQGRSIKTAADCALFSWLLKANSLLHFAKCAVYKKNGQYKAELEVKLGMQELSQEECRHAIFALRAGMEELSSEAAALTNLDLAKVFLQMQGEVRDSAVYERKE